MWKYIEPDLFFILDGLAFLSLDYFCIGGNEGKILKLSIRVVKFKEIR